MNTDYDWQNTSVTGLRASAKPKEDRVMETYSSRKQTKCDATLTRLRSTDVLAVYRQNETALSPAAVRMTTAWPTAEAFGLKWNASQLFQLALAKRDYCLLTENSPTLGTLAEGYGQQQAAAWLTSQLLNINGLFNIPTDKQVQPTQALVAAHAWINVHPRLKCSELWVFLTDWFGGVYGKKLYGTIDLTELGEDLNTHLRRRDELAYKELKRKERRDRAAEIAEFDRQLTELRTLRQSPDWDGLPEERRQSIDGYLAFYDGYTPKTPQNGPNTDENPKGV